MRGRTGLSRCLVAAAMASAAFLSGCAVSQSQEPGGEARPGRAYGAELDGRETLLVGSEPRTYVFGGDMQPTSTPKPAIIALHGGQGNGDTARDGFQFEDMARTRGILMVYPDAVGTPDIMPGGRWNDGRRFSDAALESETVASRPEDVRFLTELAAELVESQGVDPDRIYLVGASNGGMMTLRAACDAPEAFAGFGVVIANFPDALAERCDPDTTRPMIFIAGTADTFMPYEGGPVAPIAGGDRGLVIPTEDTVEWWAAQKACAQGPAETAIAASPGAATHTVRLDWAGCDSEPGLRFFRVEDGGHRWSNDPRQGPLARLAGTSTTDIAFEEEIWDFLSPDPDQTH